MSIRDKKRYRKAAKIARDKRDKALAKQYKSRPGINHEYIIFDEVCDWNVATKKELKEEGDK